MEYLAIGLLVLTILLGAPLWLIAISLTEIKAQLRYKNLLMFQDYKEHFPSWHVPEVPE